MQKKMKLYSLVSFSCIAMLISQSIMAQAPEIEWAKLYGGTRGDAPSAISGANDGGFFVAGTVSSFDDDVVGFHGGILDGWIIKLASNGDLQWQRALGGGEMDEINNIQATADGGCIAVGHTLSVDGDVMGNNGITGGWIVKLDEMGNIEWQKTRGTFEIASLYAVKQSADGGYIAVGRHGDYNGWVIKFDASGSIVWEKAFGGFLDQFRDVVPTLDGGYIAAGFISVEEDLTEDGIDAWIIKLDNMGNIEWENTYGGSKYDEALTILQTSDGGYVFGGSSVSEDGDVAENRGISDSWIVRLTASGTIQWQKTMGGSQRDLVNEIIETSDGDLVFVGSTFSNDGDIEDAPGGMGDCWVVQLSGSGEVQWKGVFGGSASDFGTAIHQTLDGGFLMVAGSNSSDGDVNGFFREGDFWIVKLGNPTAIEEEVETDNTLLLYPNPSVGRLLVDYKLHVPMHFTIYDMLGKKVMQKELQHFPEVITLDGCASGWYYYKATDIQGREQSGKIQVQKP